MLVFAVGALRVTLQPSVYWTPQLKMAKRFRYVRDEWEADDIVLSVAA